MGMTLERMTTHTKLPNTVEKWHVIDAEGERLGRLATRVAGILQGKHRADYSRHLLGGDFVIVVNAAKVGVSGNKLAQKTYYRHTGYVGHLRSRTLQEMLDRFPTRVIEQAVKGMLPRNKLGRRMLRRLKVYGAETHPHEAQVNAGTGKPKQEPAAPPTSRRARRAAAAPEQAAVLEAVAAETTAAVEAAAEAPAEEPKAAPTRTRARRPAAKTTATEAKAPARPRARRTAAKTEEAAGATAAPRRRAARPKPADSGDQGEKS